MTKYDSTHINPLFMNGTSRQSWFKTCHLLNVLLPECLGKVVKNGSKEQPSYNSCTETAKYCDSTAATCELLNPSWNLQKHAMFLKCLNAKRPHRPKTLLPGAVGYTI